MQSTFRPRGVWTILLLYSVSTVWFLIKIWRTYSEQPPASGAVAEYLQNPGTRTVTVIGMMLTIAFVVALFKMRRVAVTIYVGYVVLAVCSILWSIFFTNYLSVFQEGPLRGVLFALVAMMAMAIPVQVYLYLRSLVRDGALT
jgi:hypothetical protein